MKKRFQFDIIATRNLWFGLSIVLALAGIASLFIQKLNYGVDFTGGRIIQFEAGGKITTGEVERIVNRFGIRHNPVQLLAGERELLLRTVDYSEKEQAIAFNDKIRRLKIAFNVELYDINPGKFVLYDLEGKLSQERVDKLLAEKGFFQAGRALVAKTVEIPAAEEGGAPTWNVTLQFKGVTDQKDIKKLATAIYDRFNGYRQFSKEDKVDPVFGHELQNKAIIALLIATIGILIYVTVRFEFWFALAAVVALIHDFFMTAGFFSIFQLEVNSSFVAIILTVFGYSINDTIVIFDRIRENRRKDKKAPLDRLINFSLWETMARSINTVLTTELAIVAIVIFGGQSLKEFALGMSVGILSGCYSSIFVAAPLAYVFKKGKADAEEAAAPAARVAKKVYAPAPARTGVPDRAGRRAEREASASAPAPAPGGKPQGGPVAGDGDKSGDKKKKGKGKQRRR